MEVEKLIHLGTQSMCESDTHIERDTFIGPMGAVGWKGSLEVVWLFLPGAQTFMSALLLLTGLRFQHCWKDLLQFPFSVVMQSSGANKKYTALHQFNWEAIVPQLFCRILQKEQYWPKYDNFFLEIIIEKVGVVTFDYINFLMGKINICQA